MSMGQGGGHTGGQAGYYGDQGGSNQGQPAHQAPPAPHAHDQGHPRQSTAPIPGQGVARPGDDQVAKYAELFQTIERNVGTVIHGKADVVRLALVCLLAEGHLLVEDVPGTGKTSLARSLATSVGVSWQRIQFTPDLLPSDVTGATIYNQSKGIFEFRPGPVFAGIVLADEINRASPKTQSALLEVMEEHTVTVDGQAHPVPRPFMVVATQNPVDMDGTYALPEAQLDRFLMRIEVGYPAYRAEVDILRGHHTGQVVDTLRAATTGELLRSMINIAHKVHVAEGVYDYITQLVVATRTSPDVRLGASPRGGVALLKASRAAAAAAGRAYVVPEDVRALAVPVLAHRLILTPEADVRGMGATEVIEQVVADTPAPRSPGAQQHATV
jgi:MoxR-like ATPase